MDRLPQDAVAAILARLAPRSLAASRCVCKDWRATIDARCNLRADVLPITVGGIFVSLAHQPAAPAFFARPSMARRIAGKLKGYVDLEDPDDFPYIMNSCNGFLLLYGRRVVNPATRQWTRLPDYPPPPECMEGIDYESDMYLVFHPAVSQHYEVFILPYVPQDFEFNGSLLEGTEWPPSKCIAQVFSSRTGTWEQRSFVLQGEPAATIAHVKGSEPHNGLYRHGCCNGLLLVEDVVVNPATRQWARLPPYPPVSEGMEATFWDYKLIFDPTVSPHYEVLLLPCVYMDPDLKDSTIAYALPHLSSFPPLRSPLMDRLPQDALVAILARLAPRSLRADLLPVTLGSIFVSLEHEPAAPAFFARPSMAHRIAGKLKNYVEPEYQYDFP
ncbi:hypothetical protein PR202_ga13019 [Eleusine coracana subsp. coracana]|uniref:F-box domain-containing protein n=1 Tax=Eleusine coracana subsp. coracana TaxID=191504 RepID=A0AAV5CD46_ELECO|nr:hypothetical protein PR202_ga13019 [Eleusine coracana subsp. coracana]